MSHKCDDDCSCTCAKLKTTADRLALQLTIATELLRGSDSSSLDHKERARWVRQFDALMNALGFPDRRA